MKTKVLLLYIVTNQPQYTIFSNTFILISTVVRSISGHKAAVRCLDFHRYGDVLASGSMDTNIKVNK